MYRSASKCTAYRISVLFDPHDYICVSHMEDSHNWRLVPFCPLHLPAVCISRAAARPVPVFQQRLQKMNTSSARAPSPWCYPWITMACRRFEQRAATPVIAPCRLLCSACHPIHRWPPPPASFLWWRQACFPSGSRIQADATVIAVAARAEPKPGQNLKRASGSGLSLVFLVQPQLLHTFNGPLCNESATEC